MNRKKIPTSVSSPSKPAVSSAKEVSAFLKQARKATTSVSVGDMGRLIFALDATMSRQPTWDTACQLQAEMFKSASQVGTLSVQLVYFRGFGECRASKWVGGAQRLSGLMQGLQCRGGHTQIGKVFSHGLSETRKHKVQALVYIGDAMEENVDTLCDRAGQLGMLGVPLFIFQEGGDPVAEEAFREMVRLTGGVYHRLDASSSSKLKDLLSAVGAYAAGGREALEGLRLKGHKGAHLLIESFRS
ncbi:vWA domain-containing protein [Flexibacterium corallicola]|uniref:VWA domain-containing protein n=1 Tax=Flexibacterium corallicola TaxID=3037259 RepID=UPI00286F741E|nr:VWA domain-containing protein [Pseudovibrio sp. M1P-2-3]